MIEHVGACFSTDRWVRLILFLPEDQRRVEQEERLAYGLMNNFLKNQ